MMMGQRISISLNNNSAVRSNIMRVILMAFVIVDIRVISTYKYQRCKLDIEYRDNYNEYVSL